MKLNKQTIIERLRVLYPPDINLTAIQHRELKRALDYYAIKYEDYKEFKGTKQEA